MASEKVPGIAAAPEAGGRTHRVLLYSDSADTRGAVRTAVGRRPADDLGRIDWVEVDTGPRMIAAVDAGGLDLLVLDGEAQPTGGLGLAKQVKDEIKDCPPTLVLIARPDDRWLAEWSLADAVVPLPVDPPQLTAAVAEMLRHRDAALPVRRVT